MTPYLVVDGGHEAIDWYREAAAARGGCVDDGRGTPRGAAELCSGWTMYLGDEHPHLEHIFAAPRIGGTPVYLNIETDDVEGLFARAVTAGADANRQPTDPALPLQTARSATRGAMSR